MSKLQELIDKLCPNGVEFKPLGEVCEILDSKRKPVSKGQRINGKYPYYGANGVLDYVSDFIFDGTFLLLGEDGSVINKDNSPVLNWAKGKIWVNNHAHVLSEKKGCLLRFLYYALQLIDVTDIVRGTPPKLNQTNLRNISIPVPPIEVQEEIVRILDSFSDYAAELQAELQARKQQYEYYRNLLLTFNPSAYGCGTDDEQKDGVTTWGGHNYKIEWKKMGEIGTFIRGKRFVRTDIMEQGVPCIHYGDMYTYYGLYTNNTPTFLKEEKAQKMRFAQKNDIVIVAAGENKDDLGNAVAWLGEKPAAVHDACFIFRSNLYPNYISHICRSHNYHKQIKMFANEAKICSVSGQDLQKVLIPVPEYELQIKIASILDRFETLVNDLTNGLPAEIAAVKDQYEYYRNKLLTFKKLSA